LIAGFSYCADASGGFPPPRGGWAMRVRFWFENTREIENPSSFRLAIFYDVPAASPRAFPTKARSHFPITVLCSRI
jgi:hypothetical protein